MQKKMRKLLWVLKGNDRKFCLFVSGFLFNITSWVIFRNKVATLKFNDERMKFKTAIFVK